VQQACFFSGTLQNPLAVPMNEAASCFTPKVSPPEFSASGEFVFVTFENATRRIAIDAAA
jgi:hypothetical protein